MNKYQEALDELCFNCDPDGCVKPFCKFYECLEELVEKATPKKEIVEEFGIIDGIMEYEHLCHNCGKRLFARFNYCPYCGQRLGD